MSLKDEAQARVNAVLERKYGLSEEDKARYRRMVLEAASEGKNTMRIRLPFSEKSDSVVKFLRSEGLEVLSIAYPRSNPPTECDYDIRWA